MAKQTGVSPDVLPLPQGGGGISPIGETFKTDLFTGTGSYSIPVWFPNGPGGFTPELSLNYSTSSGNGPFGLGWQLSTLKIWRQTDRGVPNYDNTDQLLFDQEEIVEMNDGSYRAKNEIRFNRIVPDGQGFIVFDKSGRRYEMGLQSDGREEHLSTNRTRTSAWVLEKSIDTHGNEIKYQWFRDKGKLYLESIAYGPYTVIFKYGLREDIQRSGRTGYLIYTELRCNCIEYRLVTENNALFRHIDIQYKYDDHSRSSLLCQVDVVGEQQIDGELKSASLPSLKFSYQEFNLKAKYLPYKTEKNVAQPPEQEAPYSNLVDYYTNGLPGVIQVDGPIRRFWPGHTQGRFGKPRTIKSLPENMRFSDQPVAFADMEGTGSADVILLAESPLGYLPNENGNGWNTRRRPFKKSPSFDVNDDQLRFVDLNGDGRVDVIRSSKNYFHVYLNQLMGWSNPIPVPRIHNLSEFPDVFFSDPRVQFADMTGDGLMDLVWVHGSNIDYWQGMGNGRFAPRSRLSLVPDMSAGFEISRFFLADVNGNGISDVLYIEQNRVRVWINQNGSALSYAGTINNTPNTNGQNIRVADMEGQGVAGILWSYPPGQVAGGNYKFLSFAGEHKPYLMTEIDNGLGLKNKVHYKSSVNHEQQALLNDETWDTSLPFPLQTVSSIEEIDSISGSHTKRYMTYSNGLFNGKKRKLLGFEKVSVKELGDSATPTSETISWFHQGRSGLPTIAQNEKQEALIGRLARVEIWDLGREGISSDSKRLIRQEVNEYKVRALAVSAQNETVFFPHLSRTRVENREGKDTGAIINTSFIYDNDGNITGRDEEWDDGASKQFRRGKFRYSSEISTNAIKNLPVEYIEQDESDNILRLRRYYYDGSGFIGLPFGQITEGNLSRLEDLAYTQALFNSIYAGLGLTATDFGYHPINLPDSTVGWATNSLRQSHNSIGNIIARRDALNYTGTITYDTQGIAPVASTDPTGHNYQGSYDYRAAQLNQVTDPNGHSTRYQFDPLGRLKAMIKPGDSTDHPTQLIIHKTDILPAGILTCMRKAEGFPDTIDSIEYVDGKGEVIQRRSRIEDGKILVDGWRSYNARGWEARRSIPFYSKGMDYIANEGSTLAQRFQFKHDGIGRIITTYTPDGHLSKTQFAPLKVTRFDVTDTDDSPENIARAHYDTPRVEETDAKGNLVSVTEMNSDRSTIRTEYKYDPMGQLIQITDSKGLPSASYYYNLLGKKIKVNHLDAGIHRRLYNARGNLASNFDALNRHTSIEYDGAGRKTQISIDNVVEESFLYDSGGGNNLLGRLSQVVDKAGTVNFSYTERGLIESKSRQINTLTDTEVFNEQYYYDSMERITEVIRPDGSHVQYNYNERGLAQIPGIINSIQRNAMGQITQTSLENGIIEAHQYDSDSFYLKELSINPGTGSALFKAEYTHDAAGNPLSIQDKVNSAGHINYSRNFSYNALSGLTGMTGSYSGTSVNLSYQYDSNGNFIKNETLSPHEIYLEAGSANRIEGVKAPGGDMKLFTYDAGGAITESPRRKCEFDARGRLVKTTLSSGIVVNYYYGYDGARVMKRISQHGQAERENLYISEYFERLEGVDTRFILAEGRRVAIQVRENNTNTITNYLHGDHQGNIVLITDNLGNKVREGGYNPFGTALFSSGGPNKSNRGFIGCELDDHTGLIYCAARYYDPLIGRFISPDPYLLYLPEKSLQLPANLNLYVYAANNPLRQVDDQGTFWKWIVGALIIVALVVATVIVGIATGGAGFAFGILLAASIGSALGAGMGVTSVAMAGGTSEEMANGFLLGAIVGGAAGAAGYAAGAAVGAIGISGTWGVILAGAAQGAIIGAGNGAIIGYAGGAGSAEDILIHMGVGFLVGAALGGLAGYLSHNPSVVGNGLNKFISTGTASTTDPITGVVTSQTYSTGLESVGAAAGHFATQLVGAIAHPITFASLGSVTHLVTTYYWDEIKTFLLENFGGEEEEIIVNVSI